MRHAFAIVIVLVAATTVSTTGVPRGSDSNRGLLLGVNKGDRTLSIVGATQAGNRCPRPSCTASTSLSGCST